MLRLNTEVHATPAFLLCAENAQQLGGKSPVQSGSGEDQQNAKASS
jgi:hypothetical protein